MKSKTKILMYAALPIIGLGILGYGTASAAGWGMGMGKMDPEQFASMQQSKFQAEAELLGMSADEVKNAWSQGKTLLDIAKEKGVTEEQLQVKMKEVRLKQIREGLQSLVSKGIITQTQADQRLKFMENNVGNGRKVGRGMMGGHRGFGF
ncbi:MAG: hypothetical protein V1856_02110 [Candidatus Liptonbacteria bacterium]